MSGVADTATHTESSWDLYRVWLWLQLPLWLLLLGWVSQQLMVWLERPLATIELRSDAANGSFEQLQPQQLKQQLWQQLDGSYASAELAQFKQALEQRPWVHSVELRRSWPDRLEVVVREEHPIARWGEQGLVNEEGRIFSPAEDFARQQRQTFAELPQLMGPEQHSLNLMAQFRNFNQMLRPLGLELEGLEMEARGAWTLHLKSGITLIVGRGDVIDKLRRFKRVYQELLVRYADKIKQVDARYTNGLAVSWIEPPLSQQADPKKSK